MNPVMDVILQRKSVRAYEPRPVPPEVKEAVLQATLRSPTAGNMMLYSIIEVTDQTTKDTLARTCDNQPFIASAPLVLLFLADFQRWHDYFLHSGVEALCADRGIPMRRPAEGDLMLACCDAMIAAQTAVIAAESFGLGSCYIGDILENAETHRQLFDLPPYAFPISLLCIGYPTRQQTRRQMTTRFDPEFVVFRDRYRRLSGDDFQRMFAEMEAHRVRSSPSSPQRGANVGQAVYLRKFSAEFSTEMTRSVQVLLHTWLKG
jgi:nitroreductase